MVWSKSLLNGWDLFQKGITYEEFVARYNDKERVRFEDAYEKASFTASDLSWSDELKKAFGGPIPTIIMAENWCLDCMMSIAVFGRLMKETAAFDVRIIYRDDPNLSQKEKHDFLTWGREKIPVFVFMDQKGREIGRYASRPYTLEIAGIQGDIEKVKAMYQDGSYRQEMLSELKAALAFEV
ncbi:MAG: thioredoxin family protein [Candidatus Carbobacillus altaicus]|nr:thioredoxin family protein [Candidatus Carbobacillus altaicus]